MANAVSRAVLEVLLDRINQGAAALSPEGELVYLNQRLATLLGRTRAQLVGKPLAELVAEADREALAEALEAGRHGTSQCRITVLGSDFRALIVFAPLGHGQLSCLITAQ
jgi:PAS domain S-box-containing protein